MSGSTRFFTATAFSLILNPSLPGQRQPAQYAPQVVAPRDLLEARAIQRVDVHVEPPQPRIVQRLREFLQQHAVGGQRQVLNPRNGRQPPDQYRQIAPHQRLSAGDPQLADSQPDGHAHEAFDLFKVQNLAALHKMHTRLRHAVKAADVAPVGDTDAQVIVHPPEGIQ